MVDPIRSVGPSTPSESRTEGQIRAAERASDSLPADRVTLGEPNTTSASVQPVTGESSSSPTPKVIQGKTLWKSETQDYYPIHHIELSLDGKIIYAKHYPEYSREPSINRKHALLRINAEDGKLIGKSEVWVGQMMVPSREGLYITNPYGQVSRLDRDGNLVWKEENSSSHYMSGSGAVDSQGNLYVKHSGGVSKLLSHGVLAWKSKPSKITNIFSVSPDDQVVYLEREAEICKMNPDGEIFWESKSGKNVAAILAIAPDDQSFYVKTPDYELGKLNSAGELIWKSKTKGAIGYQGRILPENNVIYTSAQAQRGCKVYKFDLAGKLLEEAPFEWKMYGPQLFSPDGRVSYTTQKRDKIDIYALTIPEN